MNLITIYDSNKTEDEFNFEPELNVNVSIIFYVIQWLLFFPTIYVNVLVIQMAKKEDLSISLELKVVSVIYIIASVGSIVYQGLIKFAFPVSILTGDWFCETSNVLMGVIMAQQLVFTFTICVYRYVFIIYRETCTETESIKKKVTWTIFVGKWIVLVIITAKYIIFDQKYAFVKFWTSVCNGDVLTYWKEYNVNRTEIEYIKFYLSFVRAEDDGSMITIFGRVEDPVLTIFLQAYCILADVIIVITCSNMTEGFMYYRIAKLWEE